MIRQLTAQDFAPWKALRLEAVRLHPECFGESYDGVDRQNESWFHSSLKTSNTFGYEEEGALVALIGIFSMQPKNMRHRAGLFGLYVTEAHRGKGVASALIRHAIAHVAPHHNQLHLTVTTTNSPAIALYEKHGFSIYGTEPDALLVEGTYYDEYLMLRKL